MEKNIDKENLIKKLEQAGLEILEIKEEGDKNGLVWAKNKWIRD